MNVQRMLVRLGSTAMLGLLLILAGCERISPAAPAPASSPTAAGEPAIATSPAQPAYWPTREWRVSTPAEQGMDGALLAQMLETVRAQNLEMHSLLVIRHGYIVSETYFASQDQHTRHELYSCTKSFVGTLAGIAVDQGALEGIDRAVLDFFPGETLKNQDARKQAITVEHLLTMTTGLDWYEGDAGYRALYMSGDWTRYMLDLPMRDAPGQRFNYCSGCSHLLGAVVQSAAGTKLQEYARRNLFQPLGITNWRWDADAHGTAIGGWGLQLTPREMAKLGLLYLHQGAWDGKQVVSRAWVEQATRPQTTTESPLGYGYQWWTYPKWGAYTALGLYGQTIFVIPRLDLIVATTAQLASHDPIYELIETYIVPAAGG